MKVIGMKNEIMRDPESGHHFAGRQGGLPIFSRTFSDSPCLGWVLGSRGGADLTLP